jgi:hypothetical protein
VARARVRHAAEGPGESSKVQGISTADWGVRSTEKHTYSATGVPRTHGVLHSMAATQRQLGARCLEQAAQRQYPVLQQVLSWRQPAVCLLPLFCQAAEHVAKWDPPTMYPLPHPSCRAAVQQQQQLVCSVFTCVCSHIVLAARLYVTVLGGPRLALASQLCHPFHTCCHPLSCCGIPFKPATIPLTPAATPSSSHLCCLQVRPSSAVWPSRSCRSAPS